MWIHNPNEDPIMHTINQADACILTNFRHGEEDLFQQLSSFIS
jgi:hypothetical protein